MKDFEIKAMDDLPEINHCTNFCPNCGIKLVSEMLDKEADEDMMIIYNCKCGCRFDVDINDHNCQTIVILEKQGVNQLDNCKFKKYGKII